jgi:outer membrane lipoprotein-sorting protein
MCVVRPVLFTLLTATALSAQNRSADSPDGLTILQRMSEHYAAATSWHIEATEERTSENEYSRGWTKTVMTAAVSGNKYRYEGHSSTGSALHISDGKMAWNLHPEEHAYTQEPAPANGYQPLREWQMNEQPAMQAVSLRKNFADFARHYSTATRLPDETTTQSGREYPCYVVRVMNEQRKGPKTQEFSIDETLWIDNATWVVRKTASHENTIMYSGSAHIPQVQDKVTTYKTAELNSPVPDGLFRFEPPADAKLVPKFKDAMNGEQDLTDETAPDVQLVTGNGKRVPLSSYRGKPVLLDFWATWCAPCVASGLPDILYQRDC